PGPGRVEDGKSVAFLRIDQSQRVPDAILDGLRLGRHAAAACCFLSFSHSSQKGAPSLAASRITCAWAWTSFLSSLGFCLALSDLIASDSAALAAAACCCAALAAAFDEAVFLVMRVHLKSMKYPCLENS